MSNQSRGTTMKAILALAAVAVLVTPAAAVDFRTGANSPKIYAPDGTYLGNLNQNQFDPNSISNPFGRYGNEFSPDSVNNEFGKYGNPYSSQYSNPYGEE